MLRIRLRRPGKVAKGRVASKIVVIEKCKARDGKFVDYLGHYDPASKILKMELVKYDAWVKKGAIPTDTVASLAKKYRNSVSTATSPVASPK
jgi:small subunit ribosomal protein S16